MATAIVFIENYSDNVEAKLELLKVLEEITGVIWHLSEIDIRTTTLALYEIGAVFRKLADDDRTYWIEYSVAMQQ